MSGCLGLSDGVATEPVTRTSASTLITLGTAGGPLLDADRSQPANALVTDKHVYLVDVGDGAAGQLAKTGIPLRRVDGIFISHLHFDHTGGLAAILGLRNQTSVQEPLTIYGPPGTGESVEGIFAFMVPEMRVGYAVPGARRPPTPQETTIVVELTPDVKYDVSGMYVTAVENTHYTLPPGSIEAEQNKSYAYRFDLPDRSIVFTGDTGPSENIEKLAQGADLLVSEMMDIPLTIEKLKTTNAKRELPVPDSVLEGVFQHLRDHHVTAQQVGQMAANAGVKAVVLSHFVGKEGADSRAEYLADVSAEFDGEVTIAEDLDRY
jgi:ribonuclease BN (tRNA processing enzyme)